tara:strand:- start:3949 stop:4788 length:840 start_codon:yes stop_codon:yes gene_type:complete
MSKHTRFELGKDLTDVHKKPKSDHTQTIYNKEVPRNSRQKLRGYYKLQLAWRFFLSALRSNNIRQQYDAFSEHYFDLFGQSQLNYAQYLVEFVSDLLENNQNRILDLGAGTGILSFPLSKRSNKLVAIDFSYKMLKKGLDSTSKGESIEWQQADVCNLPYDSQTFDVVISCGLITHILPSNFEAFVAEISRVVTQEGHVIISVPPLPWRRVLRQKCPLKPNFLDKTIAHFYNRFHRNLGMNESRCGYDRKLVSDVFFRHGLNVQFHLMGNMGLIHATKN